MVSPTGTEPELLWSVLRVLSQNYYVQSYGYGTKITMFSPTGTEPELLCSVLRVRDQNYYGLFGTVY